MQRHLDAGGPSTEWGRTLTSFGLTDRQARFLVTVMRHAGVFVGRQYAAFAGITHGRKVHDFLEMLLVRRLARSIELGTTGRTKIFHVHCKPLYASIGEPDNRNRRRVAIDRTIQRLMILDAVLADRSVTWLGSEHEKRRYFMKRLGDSLRDNEYPRLVFGELPNVTARYFPDKLHRLRAGPLPTRLPLSRAESFTNGLSRIRSSTPCCSRRLITTPRPSTNSM